MQEKDVDINLWMGAYACPECNKRLAMPFEQVRGYTACVGCETWLREALVSFEAYCAKEFEAKRIRCPLHLSGGNEDELIEIYSDIRRTDYVLATHRNHYHYLLHGGDPNLLLEELRRGKDGLCGGRSGSMNTVWHKGRFYASAIVGGLTPVAAGLGWGIKRNGGEEHVHCFIGDGVLDGGHVYEALNYISGHDLPVTFHIEDNDRSTCTPVEDRVGNHGASPRECVAYQMAQYHDHVTYHDYYPTWPHVGVGKYVAF